METQDWRDRAACRGHDPEMWFTDHPADREIAAGLCARCPVRAECEGDALAAFDGVAPTYRYGRWGGLDFDGARMAVRQVAKGRVEADMVAVRRVLDGSLPSSELTAVERGVAARVAVGEGMAYRDVQRLLRVSGTRLRELIA